LKPTRKDLIRVLREREFARIDAKIKELEGQQLRLTDDKSEQSIRNRAISQFRKMPGPRKLIKAMDAAGIHYTIACSGHWQGNKTVFRATVYFEIEGDQSIANDIKPTAKELAATEKVMTHNAKLQGQIQLLRSRRNGLEYEDGQKLIEETLSRMLVEGDDTIQKLMAALETRLDQALSATQS
jgi:hypothetical protein